MKKSKGSLLDFLTVIVTIFAMAALVMVFFNLSELMIIRMNVSQITRKYILRMETKGFLDVVDQDSLVNERQELGIRDIDLSGSTMAPVAYGETIVLSVKGSLLGNMLEDDGGWPDEFVQKKYDVEEKRMSTAKN